jgi:hypothetical protein
MNYNVAMEFQTNNICALCEKMPGMQADYRIKKSGIKMSHHLLHLSFYITFFLKSRQKNHRNILKTAPCIFAEATLPGFAFCEYCPQITQINTDSNKPPKHEGDNAMHPKAKEIFMLAMYLCSWDEDSQKVPGKKVRRCWKNCPLEILDALEKEGLIEQFRKSLFITSDGKSHGEALIKQYLPEGENTY